MNDYTYKLYTVHDRLTTKERQALSHWLHEHLGAYGDAVGDIRHCIDYAMGEDARPGGKVIVCYDGQDIIGAVVTNETGMQGYIPENILVYIAVHEHYRGQRIGKQLMNLAIKSTSGDIALHVEAQNPAVHLYKKLGFTNPYLEMRYHRK